MYNSLIGNYFTSQRTQLLPIQTESSMAKGHMPDQGVSLFQGQPCSIFRIPPAHRQTNKLRLVTLHYVMVVYVLSCEYQLAKFKVICRPMYIASFGFIKVVTTRS